MRKLDQLGIFKVPLPVVEADPKLISDLFGEAGIVPLRAEIQYVDNMIEYVAYCPAFQPLAPGEATPYYQVAAANSGEGDTKFSIKKLVKL